MPPPLRSTSALLFTGLLVVGGCAVYDTSLLLDTPPDGSQGGAAGNGGSAGNGGESGTAGSAGDAGSAGSGEGGTAGSGEAGSGGSAAESGSGGSGASPNEPKCQTDAECDDGNPCTKDTCNGECTSVNDDALVPQQTSGDCKTEICSGGVIAFVNNDNDIADDGNPCTTERCEAGEPASSEPAANGTTCAFAEAVGVCNGGTCIAPCSTNAQCNDSNPCTIDICGSNGLCASSVVDNNQPALDDVEVHGDCQAHVCINGQVQVVPSSTDVPALSDTCTTASCVGIQPTFTPVANGVACSLNGASACIDGACSCGNGTLEGSEVCDGTQLGTHSCTELGYATPAGLTCNSNCTLNTSGCAAVCGNGVLEPGEECDDALSKGAAGDGCSKYCRIEPATGELIINEILYNPEAGQEGNTEHGEYVELYNTSAKTFDLRGLQLTVSSNSGGSTYTTTIAGAQPLQIAPQGYAVLIRTKDAAKNGGVTNAIYEWGSSITLANSGSWKLTLAVPSTPTATVIDIVNYSGTATYTGKSYSLDPTKANAIDNDQPANWCAAKSSFGTGSLKDLGTPGLKNDSCF